MKRVAYIMTILLLSYACKKNQNSQDLASSDSNPTEEISAPVDTFFSVMVHDLRMRSEPNLKSEVLTKLPRESELVFLHERTDFTSEINIGGKSRDEPWYKVQTRDGAFKGWVFGGGIQYIAEPSATPEVNLSSERLVQAIEDGTRENLEDILELVLPQFSSDRYKGFYQYKPGLSGNRILDGSFRIESRYLIEEYNVEAEMHIEGRYRNGLKDGAFTCKLFYPESNSVSTLYFEDSQERCLWGSFYQEAEGEKYAYREDQPKDCTFDYLSEMGEQ